LINARTQECRAPLHAAIAQTSVWMEHAILRNDEWWLLEKLKKHCLHSGDVQAVAIWGTEANEPTLPPDARLLHLRLHR
jgi:hypothetical protein